MSKKRHGKINLSIALALLTLTFIATIASGFSFKPANTNHVLMQATAAYFNNIPEDLYKIPEGKLKELVDANDQSIYILDIRSPQDFAAGHIEGAHNIPFGKVGENLDKLPRDKTIIVYCVTGQTGGQATAALNIAGLKARSLNGGMNNGWKKAGYPVVTGVE